MKERLIEILKERSVRTGTFTLASGKTSACTWMPARPPQPRSATLLGRIILSRIHRTLWASVGP